jgi:hypothetical protein
MADGGWIVGGTGGTEGEVALKALDAEAIPPQGAEVFPQPMMVTSWPAWARPPPK